jgi:hypothetical protein
MGRPFIWGLVVVLTLHHEMCFETLQRPWNCTVLGNNTGEILRTQELVFVVV